MAKRQPPKPTLDHRFVVLVLVLVALSAGLFLGALIPGLALIFAILVLVTAAIVFFLTWHMWREEYRAWVSRPVRVKRVKREVAQ